MSDGAKSSIALVLLLALAAGLVLLATFAYVVVYGPCLEDQRPLVDRESLPK